MSYLKAALLLSICLLLTGLTFAQPSDELSIFATPDRIFSDHVEILSASNPPEYFFLNFDNSRRVLTYRTPDQPDTRKFPYLDEFDRILSYGYLEGLYYLTVLEIQLQDEHQITWIWTLNINSSELTRYQLPCSLGFLPQTGDFSGRSLNADDLLQRAWQLSIDPETRNTHLCHLLTGQSSEILPTDKYYTTFISDVPIGVSTSPDGKWLAFFACEREDDSCKRTYIYGYDVANARLTEAGYFESREKLLSFERWVGTQVIVKTSEMGEYQFRRYFIADVSRPDSVEPAFTRLRFDAGTDYYENPPRYEFVTNWEHPDVTLDCQWVQYDIPTRTLTERDMGSLCRADRGLPVAGPGYYRQVADHHATNEDQSTAGLVRFNPLTGELVELYRAEIEEVIYVAEDERFALLYLDADGNLDSDPASTSDYWGPIERPRLALVNLPSGEEIRTLTSGRLLFAALDQNLSESRITYTDVIPLNAQSWLVSYTLPGADNSGLRVAEIVNLDGTTAVPQLPFTQVAGVDLQSQTVLYWLSDRATSLALGAYHATTGTTFPIIHDLDPQQYTLYFAIIGMNTLQVRISYQDPVPMRGSQTYTIRLKATLNPYDCQLTTLQGVNFRGQPSTDAEKIGSALAATVLEADGQFPGADGFIWWRLVEGQGWVRQDLVAETEGCSVLPVVELP